MERARARNREPVTASDLRDARRKAGMTNHESYKLIYDRLSKNLSELSAANPSATTYLFSVPSFLFGRPLFSHSHAIRYVYEKALRHGFGVTVLQNGVLALDWTPIPVPKKPLEIRRLQAEERARLDARKDLTERKERANESRPVRPSEKVKEASDAREAAENLNAHLESVLKSLSNSRA
jgi:hypothetical protein